MLHPLSLALLALDLVAVLLVLAAAAGSLPVLLDWRPGAADAKQLRLERRRESAALQGRLAAGCFVLGSLLGVVGVAGVFPTLVPGAMCGTGVIEATGDAGPRAILLRVLALGALLACRELDRLDREEPQAPLAPGVARAALLAAGLLPVTVWASADALLRLDTSQAVDCCAAVYENVATGAGGSLLRVLSPPGWVLGSVVTAGMVLAGAVWTLRGRRGGARLLLVGGPSFVLFGGGLLLRVLVSYRYEVLAHHCPWCLFLGEHGRIGYPLGVALAAVGFGGPGAWLVGAAAARHPELAGVAAARARRLTWLVLAGVLGYGWLAVLPALRWRVEQGVWMD